MADDRMTVRVGADGLEPGQLHVQHIHGRVGADGTALNSRVPNETFDTDRDGFVELAEGIPAYGPILFNLTEGQGAGLEGLPTAPDGTIRFEQTYDLTSTAGFGEGFDMADLMPLDLREFVVHGLSADGAAGAGTTGEIDGTAGYKLVLPVASGEFVAVGSQLLGRNGDDTLTGARGDDTLNGGRGDDELRGGTGGDVLHGDDGPQAGRGDFAADRLNGGAGNDHLWIGDGGDVATGGAGEDIFGFRFADP